MWSLDATGQVKLRQVNLRQNWSILIKTGQVNLDQVIISQDMSSQIGIGYVIWIQNVFGPKKIFTKNLFTKNIFGPKTFLPHFLPHQFRPKFSLDTNFLVTIFLSQFFWTQKCFDLRFLDHKSGLKHLFDQKRMSHWQSILMWVNLVEFVLVMTGENSSQSD